MEKSVANGIPDKKDINLEQITEISQLFDLYGALLTEKKREVIKLYHEDNLSLSEIAEELGVSRAAVHDSLQSSERALKEYEEKLGMLADYKKRVNTLETIKRELAQIKDATGNCENHDAVKRITRIIETMEA